MREYVIQNVDFIQVQVNPGDSKVYFPVSSHLLGKTILFLESCFAPFATYDLTGRYPVLASENLYVTLFDVNGNLIVDSLTISYFNSFSGNDLPKIDAVIDWERSFVSIQTEIAQASVLYFSVYIGKYNLPVPQQNNVYNLSIPVNSAMMDISLYRKVQALSGKKITGIYASSENPSQEIIYPNFIESGYLYFVPNDSSRYLNWIPISFFSGLESLMQIGTIPLWRKFIDPVEINFDRSKIYIRSDNSESRILNLTFCYE